MDASDGSGSNRRSDGTEINRSCDEWIESDGSGSKLWIREK